MNRWTNWMALAGLVAGNGLGCGGGGAEQAPKLDEQKIEQTGPGSQPAASQPTSLPNKGLTPPGSQPAGLPPGADCAEGSQCQSGICEGQGCDGKGPVCTTPGRMCTKDLRPYCGCDGETFQGSGSCPGRPYAHKDACKE